MTMSFAPATYNITLVGASSVNRSPLIRNIHQLPVLESIQSSRFSNVLTSAVNFTTDAHLQELLDPLEKRLNSQAFDGSNSNIVHIQSHTHRRRKQSSISKRSRNSKAPQSSKFATLNPVRTTPGPEDLVDTTVPTIDAGNVNTRGRTPLMDTRSPEHADHFESNRVRGPRIQSTTTTTATTTTSTSTTKTTQPATTPITTQPTTVVVSPRMSLPTPSPGTLMQLPVSLLCTAYYAWFNIYIYLYIVST